MALPQNGPMGFKNRVLVRLLQIGVTDLTVNGKRLILNHYLPGEFINLNVDI